MLNSQLKTKDYKVWWRYVCFIPIYRADSWILWISSEFLNNWIVTANQQQGQLSSNYPIRIENGTSFMGLSYGDIIAAALIEQSEF